MSQTFLMTALTRLEALRKPSRANPHQYQWRRPTQWFSMTTRCPMLRINLMMLPVDLRSKIWPVLKASSMHCWEDQPSVTHTQQRNPFKTSASLVKTASFRRRKEKRFFIGWHKLVTHSWTMKLDTKITKPSKFSRLAIRMSHQTILSTQQLQRMTCQHLSCQFYKLWAICVRAAEKAQATRRRSLSWAQWQSWVLWTMRLSWKIIRSLKIPSQNQWGAPGSNWRMQWHRFSIHLTWRTQMSIKMRHWTCLNQKTSLRI